MNEAREKTDAIIDSLHEPLVGKEPRPRTYRVKARRQFVAFVKQKKPGRNKIRRANRQQLGYLKRNLQAIERLLENPAALPLTHLSRRQYKDLLVCRELYRQQREMYDQQTQRVDDRIVSISQPHIHADTLWQCDYFSNSAFWTLAGPRQIFAMAFIHLATRRVFVTPGTVTVHTSG